LFLVGFLTKGVLEVCSYRKKIICNKTLHILDLHNTTSFSTYKINNLLSLIVDRFLGCTSNPLKQLKKKSKTQKIFGAVDGVLWYGGGLRISIKTRPFCIIYNFLKSFWPEKKVHVAKT